MRWDLPDPLSCACGRTLRRWADGEKIKKKWEKKKKKEWKLKNLIVWHALDLSAPRG